jgi:hypothetical protein
MSFIPLPEFRARGNFRMARFMPSSSSRVAKSQTKVQAVGLSVCRREHKRALQWAVTFNASFYDRESARH